MRNLQRVPRATPIQAHARIRPVLMVLAGSYALAMGIWLEAASILDIVHIGRAFLEAADSSSKINSIRASQSEVGYDGQFYFFMAVDPIHARDYMGEFAGYVYARPLYPLLAGLLGLGRTSAVPYTLLAINLAAVGAATGMLAAWLARRGVSPWFALIYGLSPAVMFCVFHNLTEPLAYALVLSAALLFDPSRSRRLVASAVLFALAGLTRETTAVFPLVFAAALVVGPTRGAGETLLLGRRWARGVLFLVASVAPLLVWKTWISFVLTQPAQERPGQPSSIVIPFHGLIEAWPWTIGVGVGAAAVAFPTLVAIAMSAGLLRSRQTAVYAWLLVVNAAVFVIFVPTPITIDYGASGRAAIGVLIAVLLCIPTLMNLELGRRVALVVFFWSPVWYIASEILAGALLA